MAYFPNSTAGEVLDRQCSDCPLGSGWNDPSQKQLFDDEPEMRPCPVAFVQLEYNYTQVDNNDLRRAMNFLISEDGICQVRKELQDIRNDESATEGRP